MAFIESRKKQEGGGGNAHFYSDIRLMNETPFNAYYSYNIVSVSEHELSSSKYACVVGINFDPN